MTDAQSFLNALGAALPEEERLILCGFLGDPDNVGLSAWRPRPWRPGRELPFNSQANAYVTVSSFGRAPAPQRHRRDLPGQRAVVVHPGHSGA